MNCSTLKLLATDAHFLFCTVIFIEFVIWLNLISSKTDNSKNINCQIKQQSQKFIW